MEAQAMYFLSYKPRHPLDNFVEQIWLYKAPPRAHSYERMLPHGCMDLIVNLHEDRIRVYEGLDTTIYRDLPGTLIAGAYSRCGVIDTKCQQSVMGVSFKPGGASPFFRPPASELRNLDVALEDVWRGDAGRLREQLLEAPTPARKFAVLEQFLLTRIVRPLERHPAVAYAISKFDNGEPAVSVNGVTDRIGLSARRFNQIFNEQVGLTPKLFCRVRRFQHLLRAVHKQHDIDWVDAALNCGYYDQAHFIHDFREFSGLTPTAYLASNSVYPNHVPLEA